jgi:hypothetical protein
MFEQKNGMIIIDPSEAISCFRYEIRWRIAEAFFGKESDIEFGDEIARSSKLFPFTANGKRFEHVLRSRLGQSTLSGEREDTVACSWDAPDPQSSGLFVYFNGTRSEKSIPKLSYDLDGLKLRPNPYFETPQGWRNKAGSLNVFKYRPLFVGNSQTICDYAYQAIVKGSLYFAPPNALNDPFDFDFSTDLPKRYLRFLGGFPIPNIRERFGVFSSSKKNDDILMWSHYGDGHRGICLGYQASDIVSAIPESFKGVIFAGEVHYSSSKPSFNYLWWLAPFSYGPFLIETYLMDCLFTKYKEWSYEKEFRFALLPFSPLGKDWRILNKKARHFYFGCQADAALAVHKGLPFSAIPEPYEVFEKDHRKYKLNLKSL